MKKYQQLLIVSLGLVSFICFLIYKHEYDRLRNVLEVLEVFGSPQSMSAGGGPGGQGDLGALRSHPLEVNHNPALGAGSINELNLGGVNNNAQLVYDAKQDGQPAFDDAFVLKNGHGVRPPDEEIGGAGGGNAGGGDDKDKKNLGGGSGEVVGGDDDGGGVIDKFGALKKLNKKVKKERQPLDSIFKENNRQQIKEQSHNDV